MFPIWGQTWVFVLWNCFYDRCDTLFKTQQLDSFDSMDASLTSVACREQALFFPLPVKADTVSKLVHIWYWKSESLIGLKLEAFLWIAKYWIFAPTPKGVWGSRWMSASLWEHWVNLGQVWPSDRGLLHDIEIQKAPFCFRSSKKKIF